MKKLSKEKILDLTQSLFLINPKNDIETIKLFVSDFEKKMPGSKIIYLTETGSTLHGTASDKSDNDYKGIYIPSIDDILLEEITPVINLKTSEFKNSETDIDVELFSIYDFFKLASIMEANALEVLFSMFVDKVKYQTEESQIIKDNYECFLSSNVQKFIGFAINMAFRYSINGDRLKEVEDFYLKLSEKAKELTKKERKTLPISVLGIKEILKENNYEYINTTMAEGPDNSLIEYLVVLGKMYPLSFKVDFVLKKIETQTLGFGKRVQKTKENDNVNYKAFAHALRAIWQAKELLETGKMSYPIVNLEKIREIKFSNSLTLEELSNLVEDELSKLMVLMERGNTLPKEVDFEKIKELKLKILKKALNC